MKRFVSSAKIMNDVNLLELNISFIYNKVQAPQSQFLAIFHLHAEMLSLSLSI
jgi:hypothetical protein